MIAEGINDKYVLLLNTFGNGDNVIVNINLVCAILLSETPWCHSYSHTTIII